MMTSVITGASGFIGRALSSELVRRGDDVVGVTRAPSLPGLDKAIKWKKYPRDISGWSEVLGGASTVYHLAWSTLPEMSNKDPLADASENIGPALMLFEAVRRQPGIRVVFASSGGTVYGTLTSVSANERHVTRPHCAYGVSKLAVEHYLTLYRDMWGVDGISLRMGNPYGPGQNVSRNFGAISTFASHAAKGEPIRIFGDGTVVRDYIYITDLVDAVIAAGQSRDDVATLNIGSGIGKSLNDVVEVLRGLAEPPPVVVDYVKGRDFDIPVSVLDISLAKVKLGWQPRTSFRDGVRATFEAMSKMATRP